MACAWPAPIHNMHTVVYCFVLLRLWCVYLQLRHFRSHWCKLAPGKIPKPLATGPMWGVVPIFDRRDPPTKNPVMLETIVTIIDWPLFITYCCNIIYFYRYIETDNITLQWRHNGRDSVSNHQPDQCLLSGLFRRRSKKTSKLRVTCLCAGNSPGTVTRKMSPFDDVIMRDVICQRGIHSCPQTALSFAHFEQWH